MSESDFTGYGTGGFAYSHADETSAAPGAKPSPVPAWQPPADLDMRFEALSLAVKFCEDGSSPSEVMNVTETFLRFLKGEPSAG